MQCSRGACFQIILSVRLFVATFAKAKKEKKVFFDKQSYISVCEAKWKQPQRLQWQPPARDDRGIFGFPKPIHFCRLAHLVINCIRDYNSHLC